MKTVRSDLIALISGNYTHANVYKVVESFTAEMERLLRIKNQFEWYLSVEWEESQQEITDLALDFIAPLFARDGAGKFIELERIFSKIISDEEADLNDSIHWLLLGVVKKEAIRIFQNRDPVGKSVYRTLRYILKKHPQWVRISDPIAGQIITNPEYAGNFADYDRSSSALGEFSHHSPIGSRSLEPVLVELIDNQNLAVPVKTLLEIIRDAVGYEIIRYFPDWQKESPVLEMSVSGWIAVTIDDIDTNTLIKYVKSGKLTTAKRKQFITALSNLLNDYADGGFQQSYYKYLNEALETPVTKDYYQKNYRVQFEYLAKTAKQIFSAQVKNALIN